MTVTTTIRLDDDLKARIAAAAERAGKTAHAFMLEAIAGTVERAEQDEALHRLAEARWEALAASGESVAWEDAKAWLQSRAAGGNSPRPVVRKPVG